MTLKQPQNNSQNQVYTLGFSKALKHISKAKETAAAKSDQNDSNVSVFRIYPLSRLDEKGTQTLQLENTRAPTNHKSVQCEIWSTNSFSNCKDGNLGEDKECFIDQDTEVGTTVKDTNEEVTNRSERKASRIIGLISYSAKNIIPDTPLILTENTDAIIYGSPEV